MLINGELAMNIGKISQKEQSLSAKADAAFRKASHDVIKKAEQAGTEVVIWRDNAIVKLSPEEAAMLLEDIDGSEAP